MREEEEVGIGETRFTEKLSGRCVIGGQEVTVGAKGPKLLGEFNAGRGGSGARAGADWKKVGEGEIVFAGRGANSSKNLLKFPWEPIGTCGEGLGTKPAKGSISTAIGVDGVEGSSRGSIKDDLSIASRRKLGKE